jgi:hypothetical protein
VPGAPRCRNCGVPAPGAYCPECGQETKAALPRIGEFVREAAGRYVALDGRLWMTLGGLLFRPGFLTREYFAGRRRRYIRPARLFLFASLVFFAALRVEVMLNETDLVKFDSKGDAVLLQKDSFAGGPPASTQDDAAAQAPASGRDAEKGKRGTAARKRASEPAIDSGDDFDLGDIGTRFPALKERLRHFNALPGAEKKARVTDGLLRFGPYAMFVLLPAFAALLKLVYLGSRRRHPNRPRLYSEHMVLAAHNHAFLFLAIVAAVVAPADWIRAAVIVWIGVYQLLSMRRVYGGPWTGVAARAFVLGTAYLALFGLATASLVITAVLLR